MMSFGGKAFLGLAALLVAAPGAAQAAGGLECMPQSYGTEELAQIAALSGNFTFDEEGGNSAADKLMQIGVTATYDCFDENGWAESSLYYATLYEFGRLFEAAYRRSGRLTAEQLRLLDEALAKRDRTDLWALMERAMLAGLENGDPEFTTQEQFLLGAFVISAGLGADEATGEKVGELLGAMALMRHGQREFAAQMERE